MSDSEESDSDSSDIGVIFDKSQKVASAKRFCGNNQNENSSEKSDNSDSDDESDDDSTSTSSHVEDSPVGSKRVRSVGSGLRRRYNSRRRSSGKHQNKLQQEEEDRARTISIADSDDDDDDDDDVLEMIAKRKNQTTTTNDNNNEGVAAKMQPAVDCLSSDDEEEDRPRHGNFTANHVDQALLQNLHSAKVSRARLERAQSSTNHDVAMRLQFPSSQLYNGEVVDLMSSNDNSYEEDELNDHRFLRVTIHATTKAVSGRTMESKHVTLNIQGGQTFESIQDALLQQLGIRNGQASVTLKYGGKSVLPKHTPNYLDIDQTYFGMDATITVSSVKATAKTTASRPAKEYGKRLALKLRCSTGKVYSVQHGERQPFLDLEATARTAISDCSPSNMKFIFDGEQLAPQSTPQDQDMEDDDIIEVQFA